MIYFLSLHHFNLCIFLLTLESTSLLQRTILSAAEWPNEPKVSLLFVGLFFLDSQKPCSLNTICDFIGFPLYRLPSSVEAEISRTIGKSQICNCRSLKDKIIFQSFKVWNHRPRHYNGYSPISKPKVLRFWVLLLKVMHVAFSSFHLWKITVLHI